MPIAALDFSMLDKNDDKSVALNLSLSLHLDLSKYRYIEITVVIWFSKKTKKNDSSRLPKKLFIA